MKITNYCAEYEVPSFDGFLDRSGPEAASQVNINDGAERNRYRQF